MQPSKEQLLLALGGGLVCADAMSVAAGPISENTATMVAIRSMRIPFINIALTSTGPSTITA